MNRSHLLDAISARGLGAISSNVLAALAMGLSAITTSAAVAAPVQWTVADGGNGHWYEVIAAPAISWNEANAVAQASGGIWHLATITSQAENDFIFPLVDDPAYWTTAGTGHNLGPFLGGFSSCDVCSDWQWVTEEAWSYTNWVSGQPVPDGTFLHFIKLGAPYIPADTWNDLIPFFRMNAYVVESSADSPEPLIPPSGVPLPPAIYLFGAALLGLIRIAKLKKSLTV